VYGIPTIVFWTSLYPDLGEGVDKG
jgi:hypothetical protein